MHVGTRDLNRPVREEFMSSFSSDTKNHSPDGEVAYPTRDGNPMGETDLHREVMVDVLESLKLYYAGQRVYVSGNILVFYREGDRRRHVAPDVLVVKGLENRLRDNYLLWREGLSPNVVFEITSRTTRIEDVRTKFALYRDVLGVNEYFLFDPRGDHLKPQLQGYRLQNGQYEPIEFVEGRLPSNELNLSLERHEDHLRLFDPVAGRWLPTPQEALVAAHQAQQRAEAEVQRLRSELKKLRP